VGSARDTAEREEPEPAPAADAPSGVDALRGAFDRTFEVGRATLVLLRAELGLARISAQSLLWLALLLVVLALGAWFAIGAAIAAGIYELTGNVFYGIGAVALANVAGVVIVVVMMRTRWRDLSLPRTRSALGRLREPRS